VILVWGPLMIGGTYFVVTGTWDWTPVFVGIPYALGATTVIFGKHIDKLADDRTRGIHTLPVLMGETAARWTLIAMVALMYLTVVYLVATGALTPVVLVVFLALPKARAALAIFTKPRPTERPEYWPKLAWPLYFVRMAFVHNRRFGLLLLLGLVGDVAFKTLIG
jgi:1,4-dihydroxy-2-naphthoate octaprenyltransferase